MSHDDMATERGQLEQAIAHLEGQRSILGNAVVEAALAPLQDKLAGLVRMGAVEPPEGERRVVTILFCDVAGSTTLAEHMDPEAWTRIMNAAFDHLIRPIKQYEGTVARLMGDAVLAFFGAPTAHEDDPQRAVLAGLGMVENIRPFREKLLTEQGLDFNIRVGINTGLAIVGDVGSESASEYTAMGDAVNVAARMEQTAQPGTVQITWDTYTLIAPLFECKSLGGIQVKGKQEPIPAYQVLARKSRPGRLRGLAGHGLNSRLVGRDGELAAAQSFLARLMDGEGGLMIIQGEAGIGKSRLLVELRSGITEQSQITWLEGHTLSYSQTISYWPFQEMLRAQAGIGENDDETEAWNKLEALVVGLFPDETAEILPYLASLLILEVPKSYSERVIYLDAEELRRQVYRASRLFFQRLAEHAPLVLVFDDLHWIDASSAGLLEHLLPLIETVPFLLCGLSRPDPESPAIRLRQLASEGHIDRYMALELRPLTADDSNRMVHNLLDIDGLPNHIRQMMVNKADGNPFFLEEIVRDLIEAGAIVYDPATRRWRATAAAENISVPDTIQGLIMTRIDRLEDDLKRVVRRAAVIGRTFLYRVLTAILNDDHQLEKRLDRLQRVELIQEKQRIPELEYIFKHALAQEAAYDSILLLERRELHSRVGAAIERLMADRLDEFHGLLAYHYSAAEQWEKAQEHLFKAGDQAGRMAADAEALSHYRQAMEAYARVRGEAWEPIERARLERKIGEALYRLGDHKQARPYLERALALLGEGLPSSRWGMRLAVGRAILTQIAHRLLPRLFVRPMGGDLDPEAEEIYLASMALGGVELLANTERYLLLAVRTLNTCEQRGYAYGSATLAANMGLAVTIAHQYRLARSYFRQSEVYRQQITPYRPVPQLEIGLSAHFNLQADFKKMRVYGLQGMDIARKAGNLRVWGMGQINVAWSYWGQGRYDETIRACEDLLRSAEDSSDRQLMAWGFLALGCTQQRRGLHEEAIGSLQRSNEIAMDLQDWATETGAVGWMSRSYLALGQMVEAIALLEVHQEKFFAKTGRLLGYVFLGNGLAEAYLMKAEQADNTAKQQWLKRAKVECRRTMKGAKNNRMALPETMLFRCRYEWLSGSRSAAQKWWSRALVEAETHGMRYEEGVIHLEIGRYLGDHHHLERAVSSLEAIGAAFQLEVAREALRLTTN